MHVGKVKSFLGIILAIFWRALWLINHVTPKRRQIVLCTTPDFDDTGTALLQGLANVPIRRIIWFTGGNSTDVPPRLRDETRLITCPRHSLTAFYYYVTSRYIFFTHGLFGSLPPPKSQIVVNVWHGMPIKAIGRELGEFTCVDSTWLLATSPLYQEILSRCLGIAADKILVLGQPRHDLMCHRETTKIRQRAGIQSGRYNRVILWLPTFRELPGMARDNVFAMVDMDVNALEDTLADTRTLCLLKPHPLSLHAGRLPADTEHIAFIDEPWLTSRQLTLYEMLGQADGLITDVSSVWIDYLILDRPIIFSFSDLDDYRKQRPLLLEPYEEWLPGPLTHNLSELLAELGQFTSGVDDFSHKRQEINKKLNTHCDGRSTERLLTKVGLLPSR